MIIFSRNVNEYIMQLLMHHKHVVQIWDQKQYLKRFNYRIFFLRLLLPLPPSSWVSWNAFRLWLDSIFSFLQYIFQKELCHRKSQPLQKEPLGNSSGAYSIFKKQLMYEFQYRNVDCGCISKIFRKQISINSSTHQNETKIRTSMK